MGSWLISYRSSQEVFITIYLKNLPRHDPLIFHGRAADDKRSDDLFTLRNHDPLSEFFAAFRADGKETGVWNLADIVLYADRALRTNGITVAIFHTSFPMDMRFMVFQIETFIAIFFHVPL